MDIINNLDVPSITVGVIAGYLCCDFLKATAETTSKLTVTLPPFATKLAASKLQKISLREWTDSEWRAKKGWLGNDLCHNSNGEGVRVLDYFWNEKTEELTGIVHFGKDCESHRGLCHGGAYCSLMDDFCGHIAFISGNSPWNGATVQVNVSLKKPIKIGSVLRIHGKKVTKGRKCQCSAVLDDGEGTENYATLDGLSVTNLRLVSKDLHKDDEVAKRTWRTNEKGKWDTGWGNTLPVKKGEYIIIKKTIRSPYLKIFGAVTTVVALGYIINQMLK
jgi:acyl-coenzyme A thioesterase PaaI-like protein